MTQDTHEPDPGQDDAFVGTGPAGDATPEEYTSTDQQGGVSDETGVVYDQEGSPEETPLDDELMEEDDDG